VQLCKMHGGLVITGGAQVFEVRTHNMPEATPSKGRPKVKTCIACGKEKAEEEFYLLSGKYKGVGTPDE